MGLTYSIMMPLGQRNKRTYEYAPRPKKNKKYNKHKKSRIADTELINPVESTNNETVNTPNIKIDEHRQTTAVFERYEKK